MRRLPRHRREDMAEVLNSKFRPNLARGTTPNALRRELEFISKRTLRIAINQLGFDPLTGTTKEERAGREPK